MSRDEVERVCEALAVGELTAATLGARSVAGFLGRTTGLLYHHWGSLDGFLLAVSQAGWSRLGASLMTTAAADPTDLAVLAEGYLRFAFRHPALYHLMTERRLDWARLKAEGRLTSGASLDLWDGLAARVAAAGSDAPAEDARLLYAALHGLASLALSGRANVRDVNTTDEEVAIRTARRLADRLVCGNPAHPQPAHPQPAPPITAEDSA